MSDARGPCPALLELVCPLDGTVLDPSNGQVLRCSHGHSFDRARAGYFNLLAVQHKASREPGDSREMVAARKRILDAGLYQPIAQRVAQIVGGNCANRRGNGQRILDAGCGEGYYLDCLAQSCLVGSKNHVLAGIDISKWAIQAAAKRNQACFWAVASNRHLPFAGGSIDTILSMFGFPLWDAFAALQSAGGTVLLVDPGPEHLIEMRTLIYPDVKPTVAVALATALSQGYQQVHQERLTFPALLTSAAQVADLLSMTPHNYRASATGRARLLQCPQLSVTADVVIRQLQRH